MKNLFTLLCFLCFLHLCAQNDITLVPTSRAKLDFIPDEYAFDHEDKHYFIYRIITDIIQFGELEYQSIGLVSYDKNLSEISKVELKSPHEKKIKIVKMFFHNGETNLISYSREKDVNTFYLTKYDTNAKVLEHNEITSGNKKDVIKVITSGDKSKYALMNIQDKNSKKDRIKINAVVFNKDGSKAWTKEITLDKSSEEYDLLESGVDSKGRLFLMSRNKLSKDKYHQEVYIITKNETKIMTIGSEEYYNNVLFFEGNNSMHLSGIIYDLKTKKHTNLFATKIDETLSNISIKSESILPALTASIEKADRYNPKKGWSDYITQSEAWVNEKGEYRTVFQARLSRGYTVGKMYFEDIEAQDYFLFSFDSNGKVNNVICAPKYINLPADMGYLLDTDKTIVFKDNLYAIYTDNEHNVNLKSLDLFKKRGDYAPLIRRISPDGKMKDWKLSKNLENLKVIPQVSGLTNNEEIIFMLFKQKTFSISDFHIGKVKL